MEGRLVGTELGGAFGAELGHRLGSREGSCVGLELMSELGSNDGVMLVDGCIEGLLVTRMDCWGVLLDPTDSIKVIRTSEPASARGRF